MFKFGDNFYREYKSKFAQSNSHLSFDQPLFILVFVLSIFINKYVLSVLNFTYPTIFQGWQTLVGVIVLKIFVICSSNKVWQVTRLERHDFLLLVPHFIFYVSAIVAGSKALSKLPISVFVSVSGLPSSCIFLLDNLQESDSTATRAQIASAGVTFATSVLILLTDTQLEEEIMLEPTNSPYYWALFYVICLTAQSLYARISDAHKYSSLDKFYYSNLFSVIILAPASVYLEEAFQALHFEYAKQTLFHVSCLLSGLLATAVGLLHCRASADPDSDLTRGRAVAGLVSFLIPVFIVPESPVVKWLIFLNLTSGLLFPFEEGQNEPIGRTVSLASIQKNLMVI
ncbi:transmembrane protein 241-like [Neocloeon triangulifer]|uniref:transmembrane protein 241-like n=1 Tax=Neocloeon triangulifer TaxID=2078957 RepID=UPI00286F9CFC|nr:transmembrane protein 241-like [Neocloeon triangulifer]